MRVCIATGAMAGMGAAEAGGVLGRAFARRGAQVAVVGLAGPGELSDVLDGQPGVVVVGPVGDPRLPGIDVRASSWLIGSQVLAAIREGASELFVDLTSGQAHDGGAGLLAALGAQADVPLDEGVAELAGLSRLALDEPLANVSGISLTGIVPAGEDGVRLTGLRGVTARNGQAAGLDPAVLISVDDALAEFAAGCGPGLAEMAGSGAAGGVGAAILALGGRLTTASAVCADRLALAQTVERADLVITGGTRFDFGNAGGEVISLVVELAQAAAVPCVVVADSVRMSNREMRARGVQSAHEASSAPALHRLAGRLADTWSPDWALGRATPDK